jgi:hypothetical protein
VDYDYEEFEQQMARWARDMLVVIALIVTMVLLTGCTVNAREPVAGWPQLEIVEHYVAHAEMRNRCGLYMALGSVPEACAEFAFSAARCDIWLSADFPPASYVVAHERQHCLGFDHVGSTAMKDMLATYRGK